MLVTFVACSASANVKSTVEIVKTGVTFSAQNCQSIEVGDSLDGVLVQDASGTIVLD